MNGEIIGLSGFRMRGERNVNTCEMLMDKRTRKRFTDLLFVSRSQLFVIVVVVAAACVEFSPRSSLLRMAKAAMYIKLLNNVEERELDM